ncbi:MAG: hypothetical protein J3K34DRAFT_516225 [Monoraphidium minutum]|nr:MAG: hypothetical protein J3K34DRAFT_516225 [Monoraphidium minutum]
MRSQCHQRGAPGRACPRPCPLPHSSRRLVVSRPSVARSDAELSVGAADAPTAGRAAPAARGAELVDQVLEAVRGTDGGITMSEDARSAVDAALDELEALGAAQQPRPLDSPLLWGNYEVRYTSIARASEAQRRGQPAGGRFRGRIGRVLFQTTGVFQSVLAPDVATNKVAFRMFGLLPGYVGLRGKLEPVGGGGDTVKVFFERPVVCFGGAVNLRIGPPSSVQLATTYLDERVRLGKGSRGSLFVFERSAAADAAAMGRVGLERTTPAGAALLAAALAAMAASGWALFSTGTLPLQLGGAALWLVAAGVALVFWQGGIVNEDQERKELAARAAAAQREQAAQQQAAAQQ